MKTRLQLWWRKDKSRRKDERIARPERQIMLATRIMDINQYFFTLLSQKSSCMAKMDAFRSSTSRRFYSSMSQALCSVPASKTPVTNIYHLSKSRKDNQWVQLKRMLIKGRLFNILFGWHFASEESWAHYCCLFHELEMYSYSLSFHMTTFELSLSCKNPTNCSFHRILIT